MYLRAHQFTPYSQRVLYLIMKTDLKSLQQGSGYCFGLLSIFIIMGMATPGQGRRSGNNRLISIQHDGRVRSLLVHRPGNHGDGSVLPDRDPDDKTRVVQLDYTGCRSGGCVRLLRIEGGGIPGPVDYSTWGSESSEGRAGILMRVM